MVRKDEGHRHHHLVCNECKDVIEVQDDLLEELEVEVERSYGFKILDHSVKFFGLCRKCQNKSDNK
jgi:Fur family ferric uptake transcriptional regulator